MLVELTDNEGQPIWVNPAHVVMLEWSSVEQSALTLSVSAEAGGKVKPRVLMIRSNAAELAKKLNAAEAAGSGPMANGQAE